MATAQIHEYVCEESVPAAKRIRSKIRLTTKSLKKNPERFARERYLDDIPGNIRSVVVWSYKIVYEVTKQDVIILNIFHTSRNPENMLSK